MTKYHHVFIACLVSVETHTHHNSRHYKQIESQMKKVARDHHDERDFRLCNGAKLRCNIHTCPGAPRWGHLENSPLRPLHARE